MKEFDDKNRQAGSGESTDRWNKILKENPFLVPAGYFDELETITRFRAKDIRLTHQNYPVPEGYFETLEDRILAQTQERRSRMTIRPAIQPATRPWFQPTWARWAAAACLLLIAGLFLTDRLRTDAESFNLSGISDQELINYLQVFSGTQDVIMLSEYANDVETVELRSDISSISSDEIESYLEFAW